MKNQVPGINIQYPISQLILDGSKTVETRTYPLPKHLIGVEIAIIETPGTSKSFESRVVGTIVFDESFRYSSKGDFDKDFKKHMVNDHSIWRWDSKKPKWGWPIREVKVLKTPQAAPLKKGIRYTKEVVVEF